MIKEKIHEKIIAPLKQQLTQGVTPHHLALTCSLGTVLGIFPILGSTTLLCLIVGVIMKLNQPAIQTVNYLAYPAQIALLPAFVRIGEKIFGATPVPFSPMALTQEFTSSPSVFMSKYGMAGVYGMTAWAIISPFLAIALYFPLVMAFKKLNRGLKQHA